MTNPTDSSFLRSAIASPSTAMRSAYLPGAIDPTLSSQRMSRAAELVALWIACIGVMP